MSYSLPSAEVAADFRDALQDLKVNSRPEISNLTIIAKENTEHAQAISRELENHIRSTRPEWKLPALYVLDSIVKNVGTPYTVYLSRNLYRTFMDAYTLMDVQTRKAMEGLLKTWKQPVPESMDTRPVFPVEVTREIENALIKYKTITIQHQQQQQQPRQKAMHNLPPRPIPSDPWRNTPTPPQTALFFATPSDPRLRQPTPQQYPQPSTGSSTPIQGAGVPGGGANVDLNKLLADVANLIESAKAEMIADSRSPNIATKLQVLQALQTRLKSGDVPPAQLKAVQDHVAGLTGTANATPKPTVAQPLPSFPPPNTPSLNPFPQIASPHPPQPSPTPPQLPFSAPPIPNLSQPAVPFASSGPINLAELLRQNAPPAAPPSSAPPISPAVPPPSANLADILRQFAKPPATSTPSAPTPAQPPVPAPLTVPNSLLEALRAQKLLPNVVSALPNFPSVADSPSMILPTAPLNHSLASSVQIETDVELSTASITKKPRPHLIESLYSALPNQCTTCGRRFSSSLKGKEMKSKHMDWHFKVKDPDIAKRGIHRSWYISEREWIVFREQDDALMTLESDAAAVGSGNKDGVKKKPAKERYIHVPTEPHLVNAHCPICQEKFDPQWSVEANDFVWMDAVRVNGKIYHASCWEEINRGASGDAIRSGTPDSILGKRKAEDHDIDSFKIKIR